ncbi:BnaAnng35410D [Brassica napus]|uniref:BnaAnng35410D protein n=1 Tax=Brassica napus TaxID=3708 RepID=A0A078JZA1_BRANA|nr:BnaAnng35410D [Brassica napus]
MVLTLKEANLPAVLAMAKLLLITLLFIMGFLWLLLTWDYQKDKRTIYQLVLTMLLLAVGFSQPQESNSENVSQWMSKSIISKKPSTRI